MQRVAAPALADQPLEIVLANFAATTLDDFAASGLMLALRFVNEYVEENASAMAQRSAAQPPTTRSLQTSTKVPSALSPRSSWHGWLHSVATNRAHSGRIRDGGVQPRKSAPQHAERARAQLRLPPPDLLLPAALQRAAF